MTRHRMRTAGRALLWRDTPDGIEPGEVRDNPRNRGCPACRAQPGERCTRPGRGGRQTIASYHPARQEID